jgi:hypothetical protein
VQIIGWAGIIIGILHLKSIAGIFLLITGMIVVYVKWKCKKNERKYTLSLFMAAVRKMRQTQRIKGAVNEIGDCDLLISAAPKSIKAEPKKEKPQKPDWLY